MACVYIIYSEDINKYYVGSCLDFKVRLSQHLSGDYSNAFTKRSSDWSEYILIEDLNYPQARQIERHIKNMKSRVYIENLKKYEDMRTKLVAKYLDAGSSR